MSEDRIRYMTEFYDEKTGTLYKYRDETAIHEEDVNSVGRDEYESDKQSISDQITEISSNISNMVSRDELDNLATKDELSAVASIALPSIDISQYQVGDKLMLVIEDGPNGPVLKWAKLQANSNSGTISNNTLRVRRLVGEDTNGNIYRLAASYIDTGVAITYDENN